MYRTLPDWRPAPPDPVAAGLEVVAARLPVVAATLERWGAAAVEDYLGAVLLAPATRLQPTDDFCALAEAETRRLLGAPLGRAMRRQLEALPVVLTANHHGLDTFSQSVQSNLLFSLGRGDAFGPLEVIPVLACGIVPINNLTYPRGLLVYCPNAADGVGKPTRIPIYPDRYKRRLVFGVDPIDGEMLGRACQRTEALGRKGGLAEPVATAALRILREDVAGAVQAAHVRYTEQASVINARIWSRLFAGRQSRPALVYLNLERIVAALLAADLENADSLIHQLLFDPGCHARLVEALDGASGCWSARALHERWSRSEASGEGGEQCGTMFFWALDEAGRQVPLAIATAGADRAVLRGRDHAGRRYEFDFSRAALAQALAAERLVPSLFTSYSILALARGVNCVGGYYQAAYLPAMQRGVLAALQFAAADEDRRERVAAAVTASYLSGMQLVSARRGGMRFPAGPLEIVAAGGLAEQDLERLRRITVREAHAASLVDTLLDVTGAATEHSALIEQIQAHDSAANSARILSLCLDAPAG